MRFGPSPGCLRLRFCSLVRPVSDHFNPCGKKFESACVQGISPQSPHHGYHLSPVQRGRAGVPGCSVRCVFRRGPATPLDTGLRRYVEEWGRSPVCWGPGPYPGYRPRSGDLRRWWGFRPLDPHDAVARVDGDDGAGYSGGQAAAQEQGCVGHLVVRDVALHGRSVGVGAAHGVEAGYGARCKGG